MSIEREHTNEGENMPRKIADAIYVCGHECHDLSLA